MMMYEYEAWNLEDKFLFCLSEGDQISLHGMGITVDDPKNARLLGNGANEANETQPKFD